MNNKYKPKTRDELEEDWAALASIYLDLIYEIDLTKEDFLMLGNLFHGFRHVFYNTLKRVER